ncbi:MAG: PAS domain-containing protein [Epsilonproteobacteria bacterium]|nr:PAS domain-containing protein [Campylobacterota bacterium]
MAGIEPIDEERIFDEDWVLVSQTDLEGNILYANKKFREVSGYTYEELVGNPHNVIRHPDMPKALFVKMWETIQSGQVFNATIKNLCKDGKYYWIDLEILPIKDENGNLENYMAAASASSRKNIEETQELYRQMKESEK